MVSLGYSRSKQRLFCGDRRGEVLIFDLRQMSLLQSLTVHGSAVNRIAVDDINGFVATGSADGDMKVGVRGCWRVKGDGVSSLVHDMTIDTRFVTKR